MAAENMEELIQHMAIMSRHMKILAGLELGRKISDMEDPNRVIQELMIKYDRLPDIPTRGGHLL